METAVTLTDAYEAVSGVRVNFVPLGAEEIMERLKVQAESKEPGQAALVLGDSGLLSRAAGNGYLLPYMSEHGDQVPERFRQTEGYWIGVWYDPMVFCVNQDFLKTQQQVPDTWQALAAAPDLRIGVTDFLAADASANLLLSMIAQFGDVAAYDIWRQIHPKVVQYAHYLSNPVRQAGMGEVDVAVAVESETLRYIHDGYPLKVIYPADGTSALITGTGIAYKASNQDEQAAKAFADWLLSDEAQLALQSQGFYFLPSNPGTMAYKTFAGKNLLIFSVRQQYNAQQRHDFLDRWVKEIRFK
jgi:iron(III) transport system substrate-binding protein